VMDDATAISFVSLALLLSVCVRLLYPLLSLCALLLSCSSPSFALSLARSVAVTLPRTNERAWAL